MIDNNTKIRLGVIRGGKDEYYNLSLIKGGDIISHIFENLSDKYKIVDILIDKEGIWHLNGLPINPAELIHKIDVMWNTSRHPSLSIVLNNLSIPTIENMSFLGSLEKNNDMLKKHIKNIGINMSRTLLLPMYQEDIDGPREEYAVKKAKEIFEKFSSPWIVKSFTPDSNMSIHLAKTFGELVSSIEDCVNHKKSILIEEFIMGRAFSTHSLSNFRGEKIYVFPPNNLFNGQSNFTADEKEKIISAVKDIHTHLGIDHYLKTDFVLHPRIGLFLTNVDLFPDTRKGSHLELSCESVGAKTHHIFEHIIERALNRKV